MTLPASLPAALAARPSDPPSRESACLLRSMVSQGSVEVGPIENFRSEKKTTPAGLDPGASTSR